MRGFITCDPRCMVTPKRRCVEACKADALIFENGMLEWRWPSIPSWFQKNSSL